MIAKNDFLDEVREARAEWDALIARADKADMERPGAAGDWTLKDVIDHITWHEREMVGVLKARALVGSDLWNLPLHQRNAAIYEDNRPRSLAQVLADSRSVFAELLPLLEALSEEELNDSGRFADMPAEWQPWKLIAENTYEHYRDHVPAVAAWLADSV